MKLPATVQSLFTVSEVVQGTKRFWENREMQQIPITIAGIIGDIRDGIRRFANDSDCGECPEVKPLECLANDEMWGAVSLEEMVEIAKERTIRHIHPGNMGANICFSGVENFSTIPKGSRIIFPDRTILVVEKTRDNTHIKENLINLDLEQKEVRKSLFRGLLGRVQRGGMMRQGDAVEIQIYEPKPYVQMKPQEEKIQKRKAS